jgi:hypothetical protein
MKKIGEYTCRGRLFHAITKRITLFDGRFDTGYKVVSFKLLTDDPSTAANDVFGVLATEEAAATDDWNLGDQRQIAWAGHENRQGGPAAQGGAVDPDNFVVEDLWVRGNNGSGTNYYVNYIIVMEKYETTDWRGALAMVRNSAQSS